MACPIHNVVTFKSVVWSKMHEKPFIEWYVWFTTVPLKALPNQEYLKYPKFSWKKMFIFNGDMSVKYRSLKLQQLSLQFVNFFMKTNLKWQNFWWLFYSSFFLNNIFCRQRRPVVSPRHRTPRYRNFFKCCIHFLTNFYQMLVNSFIIILNIIIPKISLKCLRCKELWFDFKFSKKKYIY